MKKSENWNIQADVDDAANTLLKEAGGDIEAVTGNRVATRLGMQRGNESVYTKFEAWKMRKIEEGVLHVEQAPSSLRVELTALVEVRGEAIVELALGLSGKAIVADREKGAKDTELLRERIAVLEADLNKVREENQDLQDRLGKNAAELDVSSNRVLDLTTELSLSSAKLGEARDQNERLLSLLGKVQGEPSATEVRTTPAKAIDSRIDMTRFDYVEDD